MSEQFGHYVLETMIGRGGMGEVYRAYDTDKDRVVALKRLPKDLVADEVFEARFRRECRLAARLNEPHVIPIHDFGEIEGHLYLDMRLVEGVDLSTVIHDGGPMRPKVAVDIVGQIGSALQAAHNAGLVHRDIKPSNVLVTGVEDPDNVFAYLVDFGIARSEAGGGATALTSTTGTVGTLGYMAPERISGKEGDSRSDIYSLACVLFECLTGHSPYKGETFQVMFAHVNAAAPMPSAEVPGLPRRLDDVIRKGMAKDPEQRYQTANQFSAAARAALSDAGVTPPLPGNAPRMPPPPPGFPGGPSGLRRPSAPPFSRGPGGPPPGSPPPGGPPPGYPPGRPPGPPGPGGPGGPQQSGRFAPPPGPAARPAAGFTGGRGPAAPTPYGPPSGPLSGPPSGPPNRPPSGPQPSGPQPTGPASGPLPGSRPGQTSGPVATPNRPPSGPQPTGPTSGPVPPAPPNRPTSGPVPASAPGGGSGGSTPPPPPPRGPVSGPTPPPLAAMPAAHRPSSGPIGAPPPPPPFASSGNVGRSGGGGSGGGGFFSDRRNVIALAAALVAVIVAVIVIVAVSGGDSSPQASRTTGAPRTSGSAPTTGGSSASPSSSASTGTPPAATWSSYSDFTDLVGTRPGDTANAYRGATCVLAPPDSSIQGMVDQIACTKLSGTPVQLYVARFASAADVATYGTNLVSSHNYAKSFWTLSGQNRGLLYKAPATAGFADVTSSICGLPTFLVQFYAPASAKVSTTTVLTDFWKPAHFPNTEPPVCGG